MNKYKIEVTLHNVRNFDWHADGRYTEHWETTEQSETIAGVNIITSYWMGLNLRIPWLVWHANQAPLTFPLKYAKKDLSFCGGGSFGNMS